MSRAAATLLAAAALAVAGCGKSGGDGGGGSVPSGAAYAPAEAPAFIALDTRPESWDKALSLSRRFPAFSEAVSEPEVEQVKSSVGPEVDVVWLDFANEGDNVVVLTKPTALGRLKAALGRDVASTELSDGWAAFASSRALLDRFKERASGEKLDSNDDFKDAVGALDENATLRAWVDGQAVQSALDRSLESGGGASRLTHEIGTLRAISATGIAKENGVSADVNGFIDPNPEPRTFTPSLAGDVPGGAVMYVSAVGLDDATRIVLDMVARSNPRFETQLRQVEGVLGLTLKDDIYPLIHDESALAVYPGGQIPPILFLQKVSDEQKADGLLRRIGALAQVSGQVQVERVQLAGQSVEKLTFPGGVAIWAAAANARLLVTNSERLAREALTGPAATLADDALYKAARAAAGLPDEVTALAYGDLEHGLPFVFDLAERSGSVVPPAARTNTKPLHASMLYLRRDGDRLRLSGFATIK